MEESMKNEFLILGREELSKLSPKIKWVIDCEFNMAIVIKLISRKSSFCVKWLIEE